MRFWVVILLLIAAVCMAPRANASNLPVTDQVLPNGLRVLAQKEPDSQLVAIDVFVLTAGAPEDAVKPGLANFVARTLLSGTSNESSQTVSSEVGSLGGNVAATWDRNYTQIRVLTLASRYSDAAYLLSDILKNASFDDSSVESARADLIQQFQDGSNDIYQQAYDQMKLRLYQGQEITPTDLGSEAVIRTIRAPELRAFYQRYYTPDNIVISIVGNVDPDQAIRIFGDDLADFTRRPPRKRESVLPADVTPLAAPTIVKSYRGDLNSGYILVGYLVPGAGRPEYPQLLLLNALLGGMKTSLLFTNLREKQGLCYETASIYGEDVGITDLTGYMLTPGDKPGGDSSGSPTVTATASVSNAPTTAGPSFSGVRQSLIDQFRLVREQPPTDAMLTRAKKFVIGSYLIRHERLLDRAYWLGFSEIALKPIGGYLFDMHFADAINAVTPAEVQLVAQKYLSNGYVVSMILPGDPNAGDVTR
jgi:zinc protease